MTLSEIINAWYMRDQEERKIGVKWCEYTYPRVQAKLTGLFANSQLWTKNDQWGQSKSIFVQFIQNQT